MRLLELSLRNYRVFEEVDLELPARVIGIFGPNGSGKSSLLESILWACYGRARTPKDQIRTQGVLTDCAVRLVFEHGGQQYAVVRTIKGRNHQTEAELFLGDLQLAAGVTDVDQEIQRLLRMDQQVFRASVFAEQKQLDAFSDVTKGKRKEMVLRLLGIRPVDDARTAARREARQMKGDAERLAGSLPDLAEQEAALAAAHEAAGQAEARATEAAAALAESEARWKDAKEAFDAADRIRQRVEVMAVEREGLAREAERLAGQRESLDRRIEGLREALAELPALEQELEGVAGAADLLVAARRVSHAAGQVTGLERELESLPVVDVESALAGLESAEASREEARQEASDAQAAQRQAEARLHAAQDAQDRAAEADPSQPCPTCGRPLGDDFRAYVAHCRDEVRDGRVAVKEATATVKGATAALRTAEARLAEAARGGEEAQRAVLSRSRLEAQLKSARTELEELAAPFAGAVPDVGDMEVAARRAEKLDRQVVALRTEGKHLTQAEADLAAVALALATCSRRITEVDAEVAALAFDPEDHARLEKERHEAERLQEQARREEREAADAFKGEQARVKELQAEIRKVKEISARLGDLREEARYLDRVTMLLDGFRDHLVSRIGPELSREAETVFRELTNHEYEDLRIDEETMAIQIADGADYFPMERFSGSEADLANLALRVAISVHLSRMSGADVGMMVLDEVLASLDAERKDLFVQTMGRLASRFHQLFVITHAEQVKDQFPATIEVRRVGRRRSTAALV